MLADQVDSVLTGLAQQWPWLAVIIGFGSWFAKYIAIPLTARHASFLDALEQRERQRLEHDITTGAVLASINEKLDEHGDKLSVIREAVLQNKCEARLIVRPGTKEADAAKRG